MFHIECAYKKYFAYLGQGAGQGHVTGGGQEAAAVIGGEIVVVIAEAEVTGLGREVCQGQRVDLGEFRGSILTLNAPIATKVVCFSRLLKCLRSLYGKQCGPRSDCSYMSSLFWVHTVCFYT